jgi:hypothetical protein
VLICPGDVTWPGEPYGVTEPPPLVEAIARRIIEECRREIAAAGLHIEAMRAILSRSRWLLAKWDERRREDSVTGGIHLPAYEAGRASGFVDVEEASPRRRRRRKRAS